MLLGHRELPSDADDVRLYNKSFHPHFRAFDSLTANATNECSRSRDEHLTPHFKSGHIWKQLAVRSMRHLLAVRMARLLYTFQGDQRRQESCDDGFTT